MLQEKVSPWKLFISPLAERANIDEMINVLQMGQEGFLKTVTDIVVWETTTSEPSYNLSAFHSATCPKETNYSLRFSAAQD